MLPWTTLIIFTYSRHATVVILVAITYTRVAVCFRFKLLVRVKISQTRQCVSNLHNWRYESCPAVMVSTTAV